MTTSRDAIPPPLTVLIAGAGPTGLTLACVLSRSGIPYRLIDAAPGLRPGSRGKGLQPRSIEVLQDLGMADRIIANGRFAMPIDVTREDGTVTHGGAEPEVLRNRPDIPYATSLIIPQWRVEEIMRDRLEHLGGEIEFDTELVSFTHSEEAVTVQVRKDGVRESITARWIVGCDGARSMVRKGTSIAFEGETNEEVRMILADLAVDGLDREVWNWWFHEEGFVNLCPLPATDLFQLWVSLKPGQDSSTALPRLREALLTRSGRSDIHLNEPEWTTLWRLNVRLCDHYREGRVFLAGDAAHVHSPNGAQGMNTGIQDAYNLGWKLAAVANAAPEDLLETYETERRPVAAEVIALANSKLGQTLNKTWTGTRGEDTIQLHFNYRGSVLARDDRDESATRRAGDRAPDATELVTAEGRHRLFDVIGGGRFTLLNFGAAVAARGLPNDLRMLHVASQPGAAGHIADTAGNLARIYGSTGRTLVLIRPDGYIGAISDAGDVSVIADYLNIFLAPAPTAAPMPIRPPPQ